MRLLKPPPGVLFQPAHPLAQGLVGCWLLNESAGDTTHDCVRARIAVGDPAPTWGPDRCDFNGSDQVFLSDLSIDAEGTFSIVMKVQSAPVSSECIAVGFGHPDYGSRLSFGCYSAGQYRILVREDDNSNVVNVLPSSNVDDGVPHQLAFVFDPSANRYYCYVDGVHLADSVPSAFSSIHFSQLAIGAQNWYTSVDKYWPGSIYHVYVYSRALAPGEIAQLYREPFVMFERPALSAAMALTTGGVLNLAGSIGAALACNASAKVTRTLIGSTVATSACTAMGRLNRKLSGELVAGSAANGSLSETGAVTLAGMIQAFSAVAAALQVASVPSQPQTAPESETVWLTDALLNGMTAQAFKLGTALTRGWFWVRREGCSAIYRGPSLAEVDFGNILCVVESHVRTITLPTYLSHEPDSTCCYVVRRFNSCGRQELTTAAAVTIGIGPDGKRIDPAPNGVFGLKAERTDGNRIRLRWFYCPLEQKAAPETFKIYGDGGTGQVDLETVLTTIRYEGRRFYRYQTNALEDGRYTFVVRAEGAAGAESVTLAVVSCPIEACNPEAATFLAVEAIS